MNFEQALAHMKRGGTAKFGKYSYKFEKMGGGPMIGIVESKEGREYDLTLVAITLRPEDLLSDNWEITGK